MEINPVSINKTLDNNISRPIMSSPKLGIAPVKRLGIVRRKSSTSCSLLKNALTPNRNACSSDPISKSYLTPSKLLRSLQDIENAKSNNKSEKSTGEVQQISTLENRLRSLNEVSELEDSIAMWRNGCRETLLELQNLIRAKEDIKMSCQILSKRLGIWSVIEKNFKNDSEVVSSDEDDSL